METIKEVLIKECGNMFHDKVFIVENLPKKFIYQKTIKMVPRIDRDGYKDGTLTPDPKGEQEDTLLPGIEMSQTGDGALMFWNGTLESQERLKDIDKFIERSMPRDSRIPARIQYAQRVGDAASGPIPYSQIPRVTIPVNEPVSHFPENVSVDSITTTLVETVTVEAPVKSAQEAKTSQSERMKKYWEDKRAKEQAIPAVQP